MQPPKSLIAEPATVFQMMGGAVFVSAGECILSNQLLRALAANVPELNPADVLNAGASGLRNHFSSAVLPGILNSYMVGLKAAFALGIALAVAAVVSSFGPPIKSIKKKGVHAGLGAA